MTKNVVIFLFFLILTSCGKNENILKAEKTAQLFFQSISDEDNDLMKKYYPNISTFDSYYKSDSISFKDSRFMNDSLIYIQLTNYYTNGFGKINTKKIILYFFRDSINNFSEISDSKGLTNHKENELYSFAVETGCIKQSDTTDVQMNNKYFEAYLISREYRLNKLKDFIQNVKVVDWSWETGYGNSASGKGIIKNYTSYNIPKVKYKVSYKDNQGNTLTTDDGYVTYNTIKAGSSQSFTFYTSYVSSKASRASIQLEFDEDMIKEYVLNSDYKGDEYDLYKQGFENNLNY
jgi:hypothetical protein